jgi:hypothetical protein
MNYYNEKTHTLTIPYDFNKELNFILNEMQDISKDIEIIIFKQ